MPTESAISSADLPSPLAVKYGRAVFIFVGSVLFGIACWFAHDHPQTRVLFTALVMGAGLVLLWLGIALPARLVAHLGLWLPLLLPG